MPKENMMNPMEEPRKRSMLPILLFIALVIVSGAAVYLYWQNMQLKKNPQQVAQQEVQNLVTKVGRLILLPEGETPTVATVADPTALKDQEFFSKAQKGDQVLIYTNAKKAILYRPSSNIIVNVAPVNIGNTPAATTPTTPTTKKP